MASFLKLYELKTESLKENASIFFDYIESKKVALDKMGDNNGFFLLDKIIKYVIIFKIKKVI